MRPSFEQRHLEQAHKETGCRIPLADAMQNPALAICLSNTARSIREREMELSRRLRRQVGNYDWRKAMSGDN